MDRSAPQVSTFYEHPSLAPHLEIILQSYIGKHTGKQEASVKKTDHPSSVTVRNVAKRLIRAPEQGQGGGDQAHLKDLEWEFAVIDSPKVNAFVGPGGKVVVYTGVRLL